MRLSRETQFDLKNPPWLHCISRCVRRAFLCGDGYEHRKDWIERRLRLLSESFAVDVGAYAVMSNHLHIVARPQPAVPATWTAEEVVLRWWLVRFDIDQHDPEQTSLLPSEQVIANYVNEPGFVDRWRGRFDEIGWFMKSLKEPLSRMANREDDCTGTFWEGRFKSIPLLDQAAIVACMVYVDLNPIRASLAATPEESRHTSVKTRIEQRAARKVAMEASRQGYQVQAARSLQQAGVSPGSVTVSEQVPAVWQQEPECRFRSWLQPVCEVTTSGIERGDPGFSLDQYLSLVDLTGKMIRGDKRGAIAAELKSILHRLAIPVNTEDWLATVGKPKGLRGVALGAIQAINAEAGRRGRQLLHLLTPIFANPKTY